MKTKPIAQFDCKVSKSFHGALLVSLLEIYPKKADLLCIPDTPRDWILASAMYLHETGKILLDNTSDLPNCAELLCRLTGQGVDVAEDVIKKVRLLKGNELSHTYGLRADAATYLLTPYGEPSPEQSEG